MSAFSAPQWQFRNSFNDGALVVKTILLRSIATGKMSQESDEKKIGE